MTLLIGFIAAVWIIISIGTVFGFPLISLQIISLLLLFTTFHLVKHDGTHAGPYLLIIDIFLVFFLFIFYHSRYFSHISDMIVMERNFLLSPDHLSYLN